MNLQSLLDPAGSAKAYAAGVVSLIVAEAARFGFHPGKQSVSVLSIVITGVVSYVLAHVTVWLTKNKVTL